MQYLLRGVEVAFDLIEMTTRPPLDQFFKYVQRNFNIHMQCGCSARHFNTHMHRGCSTRHFNTHTQGRCSVDKEPLHGPV